MQTGDRFSFTQPYPDYDLPGLAALGSYNTTVVELDGTNGVVRILTRITDIEREELVVGLPVEVHFDPAGEGVALPVFRPRRDVPAA